MKKVEVFLLALLLAVSAFILVSESKAYIPNFGFQGYVRNNNGVGIAGATVCAADYSDTTDASGFYDIYVPHQLHTTLVASKTGYFTQEKQAGTITRPTTVNFQLAEDTDTWVTMVALFPNTNLALMEHTSSSSHTITVKAYAAGSGMTKTYTQEVETGIDAPGYPMVLKRKTVASGRYDALGTMLDLFVRRFTDEYVSFYEDEYLDPNSVGGETWAVLPSQSIWRTYSLSGSTTLQEGLKTSLSLTVLGVGVSFELETSMAVTSGYEDKVYWKITNDSPDYRYYFKVYMEDDIVPHIWYLYREYVGSPPGGGGCPTLLVWNEDKYLDYGVIDIHDSNGADVTREVSIQAEDVSLENRKAQLRLREGWPGLRFSESNLDQVKLYAVDYLGNHYKCPLIRAEFCSSENVLPQLLISDDRKIHVSLLETIDLSFAVPQTEIERFLFVLEGNNQKAAW